MPRRKPRRPSERARLLIEQAEALGEPPEDPLLLFSVLYGFWVANHVAFNGDAMRELAAQFLALAEKQGATVPLMIGHRLMGIPCCLRETSRKARAHLDQAIALYDPAEHRPLATRFGQDSRRRNLVLSVVGSVVAWLSRGRARGREARAQDAREIGQAATLMYALYFSVCPAIHCGNLRGRKRARRRACRIGGRKGRLVLEGDAE